MGSPSVDGSILPTIDARRLRILHAFRKQNLYSGAERRSSLKPEQDHQPFKDPGLSWSQLRAFEACARLSSFNAAAAELNLTASAIRYQAGLLEGRLGVKLFERQGGQLSLTTTGTNFARQISRPMRDLTRACAEARRMGATAP